MLACLVAFSFVLYMCRNVFNWWVGLFYGVLPSSFAYGHSINHHKYNNGPLDVVSTSDRVILGETDNDHLHIHADAVLIPSCTRAAS